MAIDRIGKRTKTHSLGYLNIYRDDLEVLMRAMKEFGGDTVKATVNNTATLTEPEDFSELDVDIPDKLESVVITADNGTSEATLNLGEVRRRGEGACSLAITSPDQRSQGLQGQVEDICKPRRKPGAVRARDYFSVTIIPLFIFFSFVIFYLVPDPFLGAELVFEIMGSAAYSAFICFLIGKGASRYWKTNIINDYRAQRPSHWERHRTTYISNTVSLLLGGVIGFFVNQIS